MARRGNDLTPLASAAAAVVGTLTVFSTQAGVIIAGWLAPNAEDWIIGGAAVGAGSAIWLGVLVNRRGAEVDALRTEKGRIADELNAVRTELRQQQRDQEIQVALDRLTQAVERREPRRFNPFRRRRRD